MTQCTSITIIRTNISTPLIPQPLSKLVNKGFVLAGYAGLCHMAPFLCVLYR